MLQFPRRSNPCERYLNNPDVMNGAGYLGLSFISGNKLVFIITVIKHLAQWWFLRNVERWAMKELTSTEREA